MATEKPVILLTPGAWFPASTWSPVASRLEAAGYEAFPIQFPSNGPTAETALKEDVATLLDTAKPHFDLGRQVFIAAHSFSGAIAIAAAKDNSVQERAARGLKGGFCGILFIASFLVIQPGKSVMELMGGKPADYVILSEKGQKPYVMDCQREPARQILFGDLPLEEGRKWAEAIRPTSQRLFEDTFEVSVLELKLPMKYLVCEHDKSIPVVAQESLVSRVSGMKTVRCTGSHSPQLSQPDVVTKIIIETAGEFCT